MKVSQTIAVSVSSFLFLVMMTLSNELALAQSSGGGEARLSASLVSGEASGKADYRERGNHRRLNVETEDLPSTAPFIPADIELQITISTSRIASEIGLKRGQHRTIRYEVSKGLEHLAQNRERNAMVDPRFGRHGHNWTALCRLFPGSYAFPGPLPVKASNLLNFLDQACTTVRHTPCC